MRAVRIEQTGGPEVLQLVEIDRPTPAPGQVLVRNEAIGLNFIDTYYRTGLFPAQLPLTPGAEGAGVVEAVGEGVSRFSPGDRVAYFCGIGAYGEYVAVPEARVAAVPEGLDTRTAAAICLKGMTAEYLLHRAYAVSAGQTILVHAAAGGVGQLLVQWAKVLGAEVIATVGSEAKAQLVRGLGADHVILYRDQDVAAEVRAITGGKGVPVAYDSVGADTFEGTLKSLSRRGLFVYFGASSGPIPPFQLQRLSAGSLYVTRPALADYTSTAEELSASAAKAFEVVRSGKVRVEIGRTWPLAEAGAAHTALESRRTTGASLLIP